MARKDAKNQFLAAILLLGSSIFASNQVRAESGMEEAAAVRQSILQSVRDDIRRRIKRQRDIGPVTAERRRSETAKAPKQTTEKR